MSRGIQRILTVALVAACWGCEVKKTDVPPPVGPSELGLALSLQANPDTILRDGESQTTIRIEARDEHGRPKPNVAFRLDIVIMSLLNNPLVRNEFGRLSRYEAMTGSDGRVSVVYTAPGPFEEPQEDDLVTNTVRIQATPIGVDAAALVPRYVTVRLVDVTPNLASAAFGTGALASLIPVSWQGVTIQ